MIWHKQLEGSKKAQHGWQELDIYINDFSYKLNLSSAQKTKTKNENAPQNQKEKKNQKIKKYI